MALLRSRSIAIYIFNLDFPFNSRLLAAIIFTHDNSRARPGNGGKSAERKTKHTKYKLQTHQEFYKHTTYYMGLLFIIIAIICECEYSI